MGLLVLSGGIQIWIASNIPGFLADQRWFIHWMQALKQYGFSGAYQNVPDLNYPPVFVLILYFYQHILDRLGITPIPGQLSAKFVMILLNLVSIVLVYIGTKQVKPLRTGCRQRV